MFAWGEEDRGQYVRSRTASPTSDFFGGFSSVRSALRYSVALQFSQDSATATEVPVLIQSCCIFLKIRGVRLRDIGRY